MLFWWSASSLSQATIPINKLPLLDWVNATARYQTNYAWTASPISIQERLGNQIENSNTIQLNGNASLDRLYDKVPGLKKVNQGNKGQNRRAGPRTPPQKKPDQQGGNDPVRTGPKEEGPIR